MKTKKSVLAFLLMALVLSGCNLFFNAPRTTGSLSLDLPDAEDNAKSLAPDIDFRMSSFDIRGTGPGGVTFEVTEYSEGTLEKTELAIGTWTINVDGKNADGQLIGTGEAIVEVKPSSICKVTIELSPLPGKGNLELTLAISEGALTGAVFETSLLDLSGTRSSPALATAEAGKVLSLELESGFYTVMVRALVGSIPVWGIEESVIILKDTTTKARYELNSTTVNSRPAAPINVVATWDPSGKIDLRWKDATVIETGLTVQRLRVGKDTEFIDLVSLRENSISYTDIGPFDRGSTGYLVRYRVIANHPRENSLPSMECTVEVPARVSVSGKLTKNQVWTTGNEYFVTENVLVPTGVTLLIEPGVIVQFETKELYLKVDGTLKSLGTDESPVKFTGLDSAGWQGIKVTTSSTGSFFENTVIFGGDISIEGMVRIEACEFERAKVAFKGSVGGQSQVIGTYFKAGLTLDNANVLVRGSTLANSTNAALICGNYSTLILESSIVRDAPNGVWLNGGGNSLTVNSSTFREIQNSAVSMTDWDQVTKFDFDSNEVSGCGIGIRFGYHFSNTNLINNYFQNNNIGILFNSTSNVFSSKMTGNIFSGGIGDGALVVDNPNSYNTLLNLHNLLIELNTFNNPEAKYEVMLRPNVRGTGAILNLKNNFWGTNDLEQIQSRIRDSAEDFELFTVEFDPPASMVELIASPTAPGPAPYLPYAIIKTSAVDLRWKVNGWSTYFSLQVASDSEFKNIIFQRDRITERQFVLKDEQLAGLFTDGADYYWRVAAEKADGAYGQYSVGTMLKLQLPVPTLTTPSNGERLYQGWNPLLEWTGSGSFVSYNVILDDNSDFSSPLYDTATASTEFQVPRILPEGTSYYWKVCGIDANGTKGAYSDSFSFRIPLPGIGLEIDPDLPVAVIITIQGNTEITTMGGQINTVQSSVTPSEVYWSINGIEIASGTSFIWPAKPKGIYTLGVRIVYEERSYSTSKTFTVKSAGGYMP